MICFDLLCRLFVLHDIRARSVSDICVSVGVCHERKWNVKVEVNTMRSRYSILQMNASRESMNETNWTKNRSILDADDFEWIHIEENYLRKKFNRQQRRLNATLSIALHILTSVHLSIRNLGFASCEVIIGWVGRNLCTQKRWEKNEYVDWCQKQL